ncbi:shikimate kinase [candidate division KSB1 bacterium]|nr:shikimate kinase [candidate division KSB1 bacterium]
MYPWDGRNVYFAGFMATGKTKVGKAFADFLGRPFIDTDKLIEAKAGMSIAELFDQDGEARFRRIEKQIVHHVAGLEEVVVALGGGAVIDTDNWIALQKSGVIIVLYASVDVLFRRLMRNKSRPLVADHTPESLRARIEELLAERQPFYDRAPYRFESRDEKSAVQTAQDIFVTLGDEM